ncbi:MAG: TonB-dependent receptor [Fibrobacteres bacterium]|nr:TonB-dependent receptor [Fibrobacterota bacterium]
MNKTMPKPRRPRRLTGSGPGGIRLNPPPESRFGKANLLLALGFIGVVGLASHFGGKALAKPASQDEELRLVDEAPPPPPDPIAVPEPPKPPPPPPPDPDQTPPPPKAEPPPAAVFGVPEEATDKAGDLSVATGNTLMKPADSLVQKAQPPLPAAPVRLDRQPAALNQVVPEYPGWAQEQGIQAEVRLSVTIDPQGKVTDVAIAASGGKEFDANAIKAAKATRFQPLVRNGAALPALFEITYEFTL